jgi:hypothetical protein
VNKQQLQEWSKFVAVLAREKPECSASEVAEQAVSLRSLARALQADNEAQCNDEGWSEKKSDALAARAEKLLAMFGLAARVQHDPRGASLKLVLPSGRTNDWGHEGYCVPTD